MSRADATPGPPDRAGLAAIRDWAVAATGMHFLASRDDTIGAAVGRRLAVSPFGSVADYHAFLTSPAGEEERDALIADLTVGETYFFRFRAQWTAFTDRILPEVLESNRALRRLHLWCAGCSTGPEPYTAAILLRGSPGDRAGWDLRIVGTDINRCALQAARVGQYSPWALRAVPEEARRIYFEPAGREWRLRPEFRQMVQFQQHNLVGDRFPPDPGLNPDVIFCRNVFIYFDRDTIRATVARFRQTLPDGGWLVVGHAEADNSLFDGFDPVLLEDTVLYRRGAPGPRPVRRAAAHRAAAPLRPAARPVPPAPAPVRPHRSPAVRPVPPPAAPAPEAPGAAAVPDPFASVQELLSGNASEAAARLCHGWLEREPLNPWAHLALAAIHRERGDAAKGERALRQALFLDRGLALAHYELGCLLRGRRDAAGACRSFRTVIALCDAISPPEAPVTGAPDIRSDELRAAARLSLDLLQPANDVGPP